MWNRRMFLSASWQALSAGSLLFFLGCPEAEDEGRKIQGEGDEPVTPGTRGVREGAPPTGVRQNPAQPKSKRPGTPD